MSMQPLRMDRRALEFIFRTNDGNVLRLQTKICLAISPLHAEILAMELAVQVGQELKLGA